MRSSVGFVDIVGGGGNQERRGGSGSGSGSGGGGGKGKRGVETMGVGDSGVGILGMERVAERW